jgi:hypothetical protein
MALSNGFARVATRANEAAERAGALTLHREDDS